jgi:hypothetical protein
MPNKKITELPAATTPISAGVKFEAVQGGVNVQVDASDMPGSGGGSGVVETIVAGTNVTVDDTDPANPIISASGGGGSGTVESVTGDGVDNTDPDNPVLTFPVASEVTNTPAGTIVATNVQTAINELDTDKLAVTAFTKYTIDQAVPSTASGTITLDMNSQIQRSFVGSATFAAAKILALSNTTNSLFFNFIFEITNIAAIITMPSDFLMSDANWDGTDWTPSQTGKYELGGSFDDTNNVWCVKISGSFT